MKAEPRLPRWTVALLGRLAKGARADEVLGDLEEVHRARVRERGRLIAGVLTALETLDMARVLLLARGRPSGGPSWLDFKLGIRMLVKHPGLTVLGSLAMAFAIFAGAGFYELVSQVVSPRLPLPEGDRVVGVQLWDAERGRFERRVLYDLGVWKEELESLEALGAWRAGERNLVTGDGRGEPVPVTSIDAAAFAVGRVAPLLGRALTAEDQRPGAPAVAVIGHELWLDRFAGDRDVLGTTVRVADVPTTVVGVMPEGYGFPAVGHGLWVPFDPDAGAYEPGQGPAVTVVGRLAEGASLDDARAELEVVAARMAASFPATHASLRPQVLPFARAVLGIPASVSALLVSAVGVASNIPLVLFLVLVCGNVALLVFARASSRESELVVRSALGASRGRIVLQLFAEALVLAALAMALGLAAAQYGLAWVMRIVESVFLEGGRLPFWFRPTLSPLTIFYAGLLTVVAAGVAGVLPALKVTRALGAQLQRRSAGGGGFRFGGVWSVVIVVQIAVTMIFPVLTLATRAQREQELVEDLDFPAGEYLAGRLEMDPGPAAASAAPADSGAARLRARFRPVAERLEERLASDPRVRGVTFAERLPREYHGWRQVEVDGPTAPPMDERGHRLGSAAVAVDYFDVMGAEVVAGRGFRPSDVGDGPGVVVVNESFVERILGGRNAIGQRVRYLASEEFRAPDQEPGPWHEIVGVVEDLGTRSGYGYQGMYHPAAAGDVHPGRIVVHVGGDARAFAAVLQSAAVQVDPALQLHDVITLDEVTRGQRDFFAFWTAILTAGSAMALLLSLGGIFAVMSFTVSRRTREIGIRVALGASRTRVVLAIFRRPLVQVALGVATGGALLATLRVGLGDVRPSLLEAASLAGYVMAVAAVCLLACVGPTMRALSVEPGDALRVDGERPARTLTPRPPLTRRSHPAEIGEQVERLAPQPGRGMVRDDAPQPGDGQVPREVVRDGLEGLQAHLLARASGDDLVEHGERPGGAHLAQRLGGLLLGLGAPRLGHHPAQEPHRFLGRQLGHALDGVEPELGVGVAERHLEEHLPAPRAARP